MMVRKNLPVLTLFFFLAVDCNCDSETEFLTQFALDQGVQHVNFIILENGEGKCHLNLSKLYQTYLSIQGLN